MGVVGFKHRLARVLATRYMLNNCVLRKFRIINDCFSAPYNSVLI